MRSTLLSLALVLTLGVVLPSCSSTDPEGNGTVKMEATLTNNNVTSSVVKGSDRVEGFTVSVTIDRVRVLISRMKFKRSSDDTTGGRDVKTGPAVITFENDTVTVVLNEPIPEGTYDRVKLEKHKFSSSEAQQFANSPVFGEFAVPDRVTIIIDGSYSDGTTTEDFTIRDDGTENVWIDFPTPLNVSAGATAEIEFVFDAQQVFKQNGIILNPFNDKDRRDIFKLLHKAFRLQNKRK